MKLLLERNKPNGDAISGYLTGPGFSCHTIEPTALAIPAGVYAVILSFSARVQEGTLWSPLDSKKLPELLGVVGRTGIRIHSGNTAKDSIGCILVGSGISGTTLSESRRALTILIGLLSNVHNDIQIEVRNGV